MSCLTPMTSIAGCDRRRQRFSAKKEQVQHLPWNELTMTRRREPMSRVVPGTARSSRRRRSSKGTRATHIALLLAALVVVVATSIVLALTSNDTASTVTPSPQTLVPEPEEALPQAPGTVFPADNAPQPLAPPAGDLAGSFADLEQSTDAAIGVAIAPVGGGDRPLTFGEWTAGPAWSTIKVPLAIAALRASPSLTDAAAAAITRSDNSAAETLWASLGDPSAAAGSVEAVLRETGDPTIVESRKVRPEFSAFGQTLWSLTNQAGFLAAATCNPQNRPVIDLMTEVAGDQRWGLGTVPGATIKGGWGPDTSGSYLVRQIGIVDTPTGQAAVALAAAPASGSFDDGVRTLDSVADWLLTHNAELPSGTC